MRETIKLVAVRLICEALVNCEFNRSDAAKALGMSRKYVQEAIQAHRLTNEKAKVIATWTLKDIQRLVKSGSQNLQGETTSSLEKTTSEIKKDLLN